MPTIGLVVAEFYAELAAETEAAATELATDWSATGDSADSAATGDATDSAATGDTADRTVTVAETVRVPGVYDAPLAADRLARRAEIDAVAVLGVVITGDTDHDRVVAHTAARKLSDVSLRRDTPVTFGVQGPNMSGAEARERVEKGARAVPAALDLVAELPDEA